LEFTAITPHAPMRGFRLTALAVNPGVFARRQKAQGIEAVSFFARVTAQNKI
jgi:hypothetical protein